MGIDLRAGLGGGLIDEKSRGGAKRACDGTSLARMPVSICSMRGASMAPNGELSTRCGSSRMSEGMPVPVRKVLSSLEKWLQLWRIKLYVCRHTASLAGDKRNYRHPRGS